MLVFSFYIFFVDDVHLNARGTLLYWKNMKYAVRKYGLNEKIQFKQGIAKLWCSPQCRYLTSTILVMLFINN